MHDFEFSQAVRPPQSRVLRLTLRDYSIGHEIRLLQSHNPLLASREYFDGLPTIIQRAAVIRAVLVCCQTWAQSKRPHRWLRLWGWLNRKADFALAIAEFRNYRAAGTLLPPLTGEYADLICNGAQERKGRALGAPFLSRLVNFVSALPAVREPMDMPFGHASFLYLTAMEGDGSLKIANQQETETQPAVDGMIAEILAEQAAAKAKEGK